MGWVRWRKQRGAALVEFALICPLLILLLLGIIEFGVLVMHQLTLQQAAREGVRLSAVSGSTTEIGERVHAASAVLPNPGEMQITMSYSTDNGQSFPYTLTDTPGEVNDAPPGSLIQIDIAWPHHLTTGSFFAWLTGAVNNTVPLHARVVMRRE